MKLHRKLIVAAIAGAVTVTSGMAFGETGYPYGTLAPLPQEKISEQNPEQKVQEPEDMGFGDTDYADLTFDEIFAKPQVFDDASELPAPAVEPAPATLPAATPTPPPVVFAEPSSESGSRYRMTPNDLRIARAQRAARAREARIQRNRWQGVEPLRPSYYGNFSSAQPYPQTTIHVPVYVVR